MGVKPFNAAKAFDNERYINFLIGKFLSTYHLDTLTSGI